MDMKDQVELFEESSGTATKQSSGGLATDDVIFLESFSRAETNGIYRKTDLHLIPFLMLLYLFANLDRYGHWKFVLARHS
jgi:hypothetical protein